jgi:hypothetical protein
MEIYENIMQVVGLVLFTTALALFTVACLTVIIKDINNK